MFLSAYFSASGYLKDTFLENAVSYRRPYGDEKVDFVSYDEWNAVQYLYSTAPTNALIVEAWGDAPLMYENYNKYKLDSLDSEIPDAVTTPNPEEVEMLFESSPHVLSRCCSFSGPLL